ADSAAKSLDDAVDQAVRVTAPVDGEAPAPHLVIGVGGSKRRIPVIVPRFERIHVNSGSFKDILAGKPRASDAHERHCPPASINFCVEFGDGWYHVSIAADGFFNHIGHILEDVL